MFSFRGPTYVLSHVYECWFEPLLKIVLFTVQIFSFGRAYVLSLVA